MHTNVCSSVRMCVRMYVRDPIRHLYQVEFCSFIVRYPTAGASMYCVHISSSFRSIVLRESLLSKALFSTKSIDVFLIPMRRF